MSSAQKREAGIGSFDVVSVTEKFATENPDLLRTFLQVTHEANANWKGSADQVNKVAADAGMDYATTKSQMFGFIFPTADEQKEKILWRKRHCRFALESLGLVFKARCVEC